MHSKLRFFDRCLWQEMSGIKGGIIPEISLSYLTVTENRYLQDVRNRFAVAFLRVFSHFKTLILLNR